MACILFCVSLAHSSTQIVHPSEANSSSISRLLPAKPPKPQSRPKPHVSAYVVAGPQIERFSELVYHSIPSKPVQYENTKQQCSTNPALYEPVYADASGKGTTANTHFYHSVEPRGTLGQEQYYSDPTSPSQPPDLVPPPHVYQTPDSHENSGQVSAHYEDPTLQVCACRIYLIKALSSEHAYMDKGWCKVTGRGHENSILVGDLAYQTSV